VLTAVTISGNIATGSGGGLTNKGATTIVNCTVSGNSASQNGGGVYDGSGTVNITNTIVAGNTAAAGGPDAMGTIASGGHNLIGEIDGSSGWLGSDLTGTIAQPLDPLLARSPAIGAGAAASGITTDERGEPLDSPPDIGAFQTQTALEVNTSLDGTGSPSGDLSLRQAVNLANALGGAETIAFDPTVFATAQIITLTQGQLELSDTGGTETLSGPSAGVTVSGGTTSRVFQVDKMVTASLSGLTISEGSTTGEGGGLNNDGKATLTNCTFSGNSANDHGGGIENDGTMTVSTTVFSNDVAGTYGGGISNDGSILIARCTFDADRASSSGGGYSSGTAPGTLNDCTFDNDSAANVGGAINVGAPITITRCTFTDDSAGNNGGALELYFNSTATVSNCTFFDDSAVNYGGAIINSGFSTLSNCTISGGTAGRGGGALTIGVPTTTLTNCTISGNTAGTGGGIYGTDTAMAALTDTIVAGNTSSGGGPSDIGGPRAGEVTGSSNLIGTGGSGGITNGSNGNIVLTSLADLGLAPLGEFGGPTETMALLPGSAAIGAGAAASGITTDQRGAPRSTSGAVDIGAFQDQGYTVAVSSGSSQTALVNQTFLIPLGALLTEDFASSPLPGATIGFSSPPSGASATFSDSSAVTSANGLAIVTATANATAGTYMVTASVPAAASSATYNLTNQIEPVFSGLSGQTITYGSNTVMFTGTLAAGLQVPAGEKVGVTLEGATRDATIAPNGSFSTEFTRSDVSLNASAMAYDVTYQFATDGVFLAATGSSQLTINPAELTVQATNVSVVYGSPQPALTYKITGFVDGENSSVLSGAPAVATTAAPGARPGTYPITVAAGSLSAANYEFTCLPGTLTVIPAPATVKSVRIETIKLSKQKSVQGIALRFSEALDSATAQNINSYTLATLPNHKNRKSIPVQLSQASYNASVFTVTLFTRKKLVLTSPLELTVQAAGLLDALGRELDGNDSGHSGANFTAVISKAGTRVTSTRAFARSPGIG
jgi:hypothetical protein